MEAKLYFVGSACFVLEIEKTIKIGCDPSLYPAGHEYNFKSFTSKKAKEPVYKDILFDDIDIWLFTHKHADHIDELGLSKVKKNSEIITQEGLTKIFNQNNLKEYQVLNWGEKTSIKIDDYKVEIIAVPAFHGSNFIMRKLVGKVNGYYIKIIKKNNDIKTIYITSDTVYHKKVLKNMKGKPIDILIANLGAVNADKFGGPLTMSIKMLDQMTEELNPEVIIPVHYDDFSHYNTRKIDLIDKGFELIERGKWIYIS